MAATSEGQVQSFPCQVHTYLYIDIGIYREHQHRLHIRNRNNMALAKSHALLLAAFALFSLFAKPVFSGTL